VTWDTEGAVVQHGSGGMALSVCVAKLYRVFWIANSTALFEVDSNCRAESNFPVLLRSFVAHVVSEPVMTLTTMMKMSARISIAPDSSSARFGRRTPRDTGRTGAIGARSFRGFQRRRVIVMARSSWPS
jgi:hypothetical protein